MVWFLDNRYALRTALILEDGTNITYKQLMGRIDKFAKQLQGNTVAVLMSQNSVDFIVAYLACLKKGVIPLLISEKASKEYINMIAEQYDAGYILLGEKNVLTRRKRETNIKIHSDLALLLATSGSMGNIKYVKLSKKNLISNIKSVCDALNISETDRAITSLPLNYTYGLSVLNTHLYKGASIVITGRSVISTDFWNLVKKENVTTFSGVPFIYESIYKLSIFNYEFPSLKVLTQAGGKLSEKLQVYFGGIARRKGLDFYIMYGQTEATARMTVLSADLILNKLGSVGTAIPGGKIDIIDGEVIYYGENVCMGYAQKIEDLSKGDENRGILHTKDAGYMKNGYLYLEGRLDRVIKINGIRINLQDCENIIMNLTNKSSLCQLKENKLIITIEGILNEHESKKIYRELFNVFSLSKKDYEFVSVKKLNRTNSGKIKII